MIFNRRRLFLEHFLGMLGADRVEVTKAEFDKMHGKVIYADDEVQDFCWHQSEENAPSDDVIWLIQIIRNNNLIDCDKLCVSDQKLFETTGWKDYDKFTKVLNKLFEIEVMMMDDEVETDSFFIHT